MRDEVSSEMRARLISNRNGKLTVDQWKDMVTEPLTILLLLLAPLVIVMGPRLAAFSIRGWIIVLLVGTTLLSVPLIFRAWRYARAAIHFEKLYAGDHPSPAVLFWRPCVLYTDKGTEVRFTKRLAPVVALRPNHAYIVYYLRDSGQHVLLSLAPAEHPDAERWQPSPAFHERFARRTDR
ncbi:MAG: hypothetical protein K8J31_31040 [Anaerolineae bacterium]|nr:hypothetical protein [Anaerolineae bacterium]